MAEAADSEEGPEGNVAVTEVDIHTVDKVGILGIHVVIVVVA